jgi:hypothetical protein
VSFHNLPRGFLTKFLCIFLISPINLHDPLILFLVHRSDNKKEGLTLLYVVVGNEPAVIRFEIRQHVPPILSLSLSLSLSK